MQPIDGVRKESDAQFSPADQQVRVMPLILCYFRNRIGELHGLAEVLACELPFEVMTGHRFPARVELPQQSLLRRAIKGPDSSPARNALSASELAVSTHSLEYSDFSGVIGVASSLS